VDPRPRSSMSDVSSRNHPKHPPTASMDLGSTAHRPEWSVFHVVLPFFAAPTIWSQFQPLDRTGRDTLAFDIKMIWMRLIPRTPLKTPETPLKSKQSEELNLRLSALFRFLDSLLLDKIFSAAPPHPALRPLEPAVGQIRKSSHGSFLTATTERT
jgi:hypothetical protein